MSCADQDVSRKVFWLRIGNVLAYLVMIVINILGNTVKFNGQNNGEVSAKYPTYFTPAGPAFAIWGLIFTALGMFVIYQFFNGNGKKNGVVDRLSVTFILVNLLTAAWGPVFSYEVIWLTWVVMMSILGGLIAIQVQLRLGKDVGLFAYLFPSREKPTPTPSRNPGRDAILRFVFVEFPLALFLGWISLASIINTLIFFGSLGVIHTPTVAVALLALAAVLGFAKLFFGADAVYACVVAWAAFWIRVKQDSSDVQTMALLVSATMAASALFVGVFRFVMFVRHWAHNRDAYLPLSSNNSTD